MGDETFKQMWQAGDRERHHGGNTMDLSSQIQTLTQRNYELTTLVTTLVELLGEAGHVDLHVLLAKVEGQLEVEAPPVATKAAAPKAPTTHCVRCATEVPMAQAEMTASGLMCARCAVSA